MRVLNLLSKHALGALPCHLEPFPVMLLLALWACAVIGCQSSGSSSADKLALERAAAKRAYDADPNSYHAADRRRLIAKIRGRAVSADCGARPSAATGGPLFRLDCIELDDLAGFERAGSDQHHGVFGADA